MKQEKEAVLKQYSDAANLSMRLQIHQLYSTNRQDFHQWVFDQIMLAPGNHVVEFGCGPGAFWVKNADRLPNHLNVALTDLSPGMVKVAKKNVGAFLPGIYKVMDIQQPEFLNETADVVICNHMLYHVPNLPKALAEVHKILKPKGRLFAATNGLRHMAELGEWLTEFNSDIAVVSADFMAPFALESGGEILEKYFPNVQMHRFHSNLKVTNIEHLIAYYESMDLGIGFDHDFRCFLETKRIDGVFNITKDGGLFIAEKG